MDVPVAANVLGTLGAVCWSVQLIPQIIINYRRHNATGLQPTMMMLWAWAAVPLGVYNIVSNFNIALRIQPQILAFLSLATWIQCYHYEQKWSVACALAVVVPIACVMAGIEAALIVALRIGIQRGITWPLTLMAVLAALFLTLGVLRHYWDIYVHRTVRGISFLFVGIDAMGDLTSLLSVLFQLTLDVRGMAIYGIELTLWLGVFVCGGYYNLLPWVKTKLDERISRMSSSNNSTRRETARGSQSASLHDLPSSTSVFRTPSCELETLRARAITRSGNYATSEHYLNDIHRVEALGYQP